jgi:hypothetical protein
MSADIHPPEPSPDDPESGDLDQRGPDPCGLCRLQQRVAELERLVSRLLGGRPSCRSEGVSGDRWTVHNADHNSEHNWSHNTDRNAGNSGAVGGGDLAESRMISPTAENDRLKSQLEQYRQRTQNAEGQLATLDYRLREAQRARNGFREAHASSVREIALLEQRIALLEAESETTDLEMERLRAARKGL